MFIRVSEDLIVTHLSHTF